MQILSHSNRTLLCLLVYHKILIFFYNLMEKVLFTQKISLSFVFVHYPDIIYYP